MYSFNAMQDASDKSICQSHKNHGSFTWVTGIFTECYILNHILRKGGCLLHFNTFDIEACFPSETPRDELNH